MVSWNPFGGDGDSSDDGDTPDEAVPDGGTDVESQSSEIARRELEQKLETARSERDEAREEIDELTAELEDERRRRRELEDDIQQLVRVVRANADGDLAESPGDPSTDPAAPLFDAYDELLLEWRETVERLSSFSEQVSSATDQVDSRLGSVKDASRDMSTAVEEISAGSETQNDKISDISDEVRDLSATVEEIAASANEVAEASGDAADRGTKAQRSASEAMEELEQLTEHANETVENVDELNTLLTEIEDIVDFITDIADQTNILALNANIEAARAGESGNGFTVVANEVKELASETKRATDEIEDSIERVHEQADETVEEMHETSESVEATHDAVAEALDQLETIVRQVSEIDTSVKEIDDATDTQAVSTQEIVSMVDDVGEISDQTAEEAAVVAEAAQEQTTDLAEVSTSVATLTERSVMLEETLDQFDLSGGSVAATTDETVVDFWHAMGGEKALLLEQLASEFERQSAGISIELSSKGSYRGTLDAALSAAGDGNTPAITQIFEIGSTRARDSNYFTPVEDLISQDHIDSLLDPVLNYYRFDGSLRSMPFNSSNPILAYNRDAFKRAGLDPDAPPKTFDAVRRAADQIVSEGVAEYGITFANYSWFVEQWFAEADQLLVDRNNGRAGQPTTSHLDSEFAHSLFEWWTDLESQGLYDDPGIEARGKAKSTFHDRDAAMLIGSTSSLNSIESGADFDVGTGKLPVLDERAGVLVGGASLWVGADCSQEVHDAVGEFLTWLTEPEQQMRWHRETGYFPVNEDAIPQLRSDGWFDENPHYRTAFDQLVESTDTVATRGAQIGPFEKVRTIVEESFDRMEGPDSVPAELEQTNAQIESALTEYSATGDSSNN